MRRWVGVLLATVWLAGCTASDPVGPEAGPRASPPGTSPSATSPSATSPPGATARPEPTPGVTEPVVIVTHATAPAEELSVAAARQVLAGQARHPTVAAPGMPVATRVDVLASPEAVLRAVEQDGSLYGVVPAHTLTPTVRRAVVAGVDPVRRPADYPVQTPADQDPPRPVTLTVVGDLMLTRGVADPAAALKPLGERLRRADVTVGNLESTLSTDGPPQQGGDSFGAGPELLPPLLRAGFDAVSLANNHTGDYGERALLETVRLLRSSPLAPFGAGADRADAARPAVINRGGVTFGFLGFNAIGETPRALSEQPGALSVRMPPRTGPLQEADLRFVEQQVRALDAQVDVVVVLPHWGTQYTHRPEPVQRTVGRRLVEAGADLVVGGHPHWVQGLELHAGTVIAHSLGNFVFDMDFMVETQQGVVLEATYWGARLVALDLVPYRMDAAFAPRMAGVSEARDILGDVWSTSTGPWARP